MSFKNKSGQLLLLNFPDRYIYRIDSNRDYLIQRCDDEFDEIINNLDEGWSIVTKPKLQASIYKYVLENKLDIEYNFMDV